LNNVLFFHGNTLAFSALFTLLLVLLKPVFAATACQKLNNLQLAGRKLYVCTSEMSMLIQWGLSPGKWQATSAPLSCKNRGAEGLPKSRWQTHAPVPWAATIPVQLCSVQEDLKSCIQWGGAFWTYVISTSLPTILQGTCSTSVGVMTSGKHKVVC